MSGITNIAWATRVWNPVVGCTQVSPGCAHCYAKTLHDKRHAAFAAGKLQTIPQYAQPFETVQLLPERLGDPHRWKKSERIFVNSVSDLFHEDVPDGFIMRVWLQMARAFHHTFLVLTKRPERMREWVRRFSDLEGEDFASFQNARTPADVRDRHPSGRGQLFAAMLEQMGEPPAGFCCPSFDWMEGPIRLPLRLPNVWLGTSVENQRVARERIEALCTTPAAVRFLSCEPLLGPLDLELGKPFDPERVVWTPKLPNPSYATAGNRLHWVIVGGESGPDRREMDLRWLENVVQQCDLNEGMLAERIPVFVKQDSHALPGQQGRIPPHLWRQEFPNTPWRVP